jgi:hypothetical protein
MGQIRQHVDDAESPRGLPHDLLADTPPWSGCVKTECALLHERSCAEDGGTEGGWGGGGGGPPKKHL